MAVAIEAPVDAPDTVVIMRDIGWDDSETIVRMKGNRRPRHLYSQGSLTLMSPSQPHEHGGDRLDRVAMAVCAELDIPCTLMGETLFRRRDLDRGIEGDEAYFLTHEPGIRGKILDLNVDPPPT